MRKRKSEARIDTGAGRGKYNVTITGSQGVQVGDGNTQSNVFYNR
jgi:hypothetical protein